jgi:hypothetical protein
MGQGVGRGTERIMRMRSHINTKSSGLIFRAVVVASQEKRVVGSLAVENRWVHQEIQGPACITQDMHRACPLQHRSVKSYHYQCLQPHDVIRVFCKHKELEIETRPVGSKQIKVIATIPEEESFPLHWPLSRKHVLRLPTVR